MEKGKIIVRLLLRYAIKEIKNETDSKLFHNLACSYINPSEFDFVRNYQ